MRSEEAIKIYEDSEKLRNELLQTPARPSSNNFKSNPFVPLGCFATATALALGLWSFRKGRANLSHQMMKFRIIAQGFTITAIVAGFLTASDKTFK